MKTTSDKLFGLEEGQLLHCIVKVKDRDEYLFDRGVVVDVYDQFCVIALKKINETRTVYYDQFCKDDYKKIHSIECIPVTKGGLPVKMKLIQEYPTYKEYVWKRLDKPFILLLIILCITIGTIIGVVSATGELPK